MQRGVAGDAPSSSSPGIPSSPRRATRCTRIRTTTNQETTTMTTDQETTELETIRVELPLPMRTASRLMLAVAREWPGASVRGDELAGALVFVIDPSTGLELDLDLDLADDYRLDPQWLDAHRRYVSERTADEPLGEWLARSTRGALDMFLIESAIEAGS